MFTCQKVLPLEACYMWYLQAHLTNVAVVPCNSQVARALHAAGFRKGDPIAMDMPMNDHSISIYLAIVLAGCVVVSIADSFAAPEIATRLRVSKAKGIFTQVQICLSTSSQLSPNLAMLVVNHALSALTFASLTPGCHTQRRQACSSLQVPHTCCHWVSKPGLILQPVLD